MVMANTTSINLGEHFTSFLGQLTENGRYGSVSEAVRAGLRLLESEETKMAALYDGLEEGEASGECDERFSDIVNGAVTSYKARSHSE